MAEREQSEQRATPGETTEAEVPGGDVYSEIRSQLTASRERSYSQGRQGCCGKAADYLGRKGPPPGSPWSRGA